MALFKVIYYLFFSHFIAPISLLYISPSASSLYTVPKFGAIVLPLQLPINRSTDKTGTLESNPLTTEASTTAEKATESVTFHSPKEVAGSEEKVVLAKDGIGKEPIADLGKPGTGNKEKQTNREESDEMKRIKCKGNWTNETPLTSTRFCWLYKVDHILNASDNSIGVVCKGVKDFQQTLDYLQDTCGPQMKTLRIENSFLPEVNLSLFPPQRFHRLQELTVTCSNVGKITGRCPVQLLALNVSKNVIRKIDEEVFFSHELDNRQIQLKLEHVDLSYNQLTQVPDNLLSLESMKSLKLSGNVLNCDFVWGKLTAWYIQYGQKKNVLKQVENTFCGVLQELPFVGISLMSMIDAKMEFSTICEGVDKSICKCDMFTLVKNPGFQSHLTQVRVTKYHENKLSVAVKLDCSGKDLIELPPIPIQTWQLNVSNNVIEDLSRLDEPMYKNLQILDASNNLIQTLDGLENTFFIDQFKFLNLRKNYITEIPEVFFAHLGNTNRHWKVLLGGNYINCNGKAVEQIKALLMDCSKYIPDIQDVLCQDSGHSLVTAMNFEETCTTNDSVIEELDKTVELKVHIPEGMRGILFIFFIEVFILVGFIFMHRPLIPFPRNHQEEIVAPTRSELIPKIAAVEENGNAPPDERTNMKVTIIGVNGSQLPFVLCSISANSASSENQVDDGKKDTENVAV